MRTLEEYMRLPYKMEIVEDVEEGGFAISFPDLKGCLTCADTLLEALSAAAEAKKVWLEAALDEGIAIPEPGSLEHYSGQFKLRLPKSLHRQLAEQSRREGISMNQYCLYLLARNAALENS